jgi:hypothetical protein
MPKAEATGLAPLRIGTIRTLEPLCSRVFDFVVATSVIRHPKYLVGRCSYSLPLSFSPVKAGGNDADFQVGRVNSGVWN